MSSLAGRHIISIFDLTKGEIEGIFRLADKFLYALQQGPLSLVKRRARRKAKRPREDRASLARICANQVLATVFFEPSTRTRLSFESAMHRLGGRVVSVSDPRTSSAAKGERLADTIRVIASYADAIVLRDPHEGAALLAAESLDPTRLAELGRRVPIINGGDGAHEHPTQTLCDLYTIRREHGRIAGLNVALCGDLLHARTVHSLAYGLARFGANIKCISPPNLRLPEYVKRRLESEFNCVPAEYEHIGQLAHPGSQDVIYAAEKRGRRAAGRLVSDEELRDVIARLLDAVYVTRIQAERFARPEDAEAARGTYLVDPDVLMRIGKDTTIMHPLPRVNEVDALVDQDARAAYFRQASYGIPIRMALMALLLGGRRLGGRRKSAEPDETLTPRPSPDAYLTGFKCANPTCITNHEPGARARMEQMGDTDVLRCVYCEHEVSAPRGSGGAR